jgi:hypothetical protein
MSTQTEAAQDIQEMMAAWATIERTAKQCFPNASKEELYQICKGAMNRQLEGDAAKSHGGLAQAARQKAELAGPHVKIVQ